MSIKPVMFAAGTAGCGGRWNPAQRVRRRAVGREHRQHQSRQAGQHHAAGRWDHSHATHQARCAGPNGVRRRLEHRAGRDHRCAIGWALPESAEQAGVIMEAHGVLDVKDAVRTIERMLDEAFQVRGARMRERKILAIEHRVERTGCAIAAVTLLSPDAIDNRVVVTG